MHQHPSADEDFPSEENIAAPVIRLIEKEKLDALPPTGPNLVVKQTSLASNNEEESSLGNKVNTFLCFTAVIFSWIYAI